MKNLISFIAYYLLYTVWFVFSLLPFRVLYVISDFLYLVTYYVVKYRRRVIRQNIKSSFPEKSDIELRTIEKGFYHWFCDYLVETIKLMTMSKRQLMEHLVFTGVDVIDHYVAQGRSCGVYLGHYGQWGVDNFTTLLDKQQGPVYANLSSSRKQTLRQSF